MDMTLMYKSTVCFLVFWNKINPFLTKNSKNLHVLNIVITVIITHYSYYGLINNKADVGQTSFFRHSISSGPSSSSDDSDNMPSKARHEATNARLKGHCLLCIVHSPAKPLGISRYLRYNTVNVSFAEHFSNMPYFRQSQSRNANTDFHQIWSIYSTTLHINADNFLSSYIKYKYLFFMFEKKIRLLLNRSVHRLSSVTTCIVFVLYRIE